MFLLVITGVSNGRNLCKLHELVLRHHYSTRLQDAIAVLRDLDAMPDRLVVTLSGDDQLTVIRPDANVDCWAFAAVVKTDSRSFANQVKADFADDSDTEGLWWAGVDEPGLLAVLQTAPR